MKGKCSNELEDAAESLLLEVMPPSITLCGVLQISSGCPKSESHLEAEAGRAAPRTPPSQQHGRSQCHLGSTRPPGFAGWSRVVCVAAGFSGLPCVCSRGQPPAVPEGTSAEWQWAAPAGTPAGRLQKLIQCFIKCCAHRCQYCISQVRGNTDCCRIWLLAGQQACLWVSASFVKQL